LQFLQLTETNVEISAPVMCRGFLFEEMLMPDDEKWSEYYRRLTGRELRPLLLSALAIFESPGQVIDLGCGDGRETLHLIQHGWHVLAIDLQPEAIQLVESKIAPEHSTRLQTQVASFENVAWIPADLIYAGVSLPFCAPSAFDTVWGNLTNAIRPHGRFAGHFFGDRDTWATEPEMTCLSRTAVEALFDGFAIEHFEEHEDDRPTALGDPKHWHIFEVIAQKH
jgi:tellurite methyltransferase